MGLVAAAARGEGAVGVLGVVGASREPARSGVVEALVDAPPVHCRRFSRPWRGLFHSLIRWLRSRRCWRAAM